MYKTPSARRRKKDYPALNLTSVLDVVFILNFFLITSAQFIKIYEIGSDLPIYKLETEDTPDIKKFELAVAIDQTKVILEDRIGKRRIAEVSHLEEGFDANLNEKVKALKLNYPKESRAVVLPMDTVPYQKLVKILDALRMSMSDKGEKLPLFNQIIFE